MPVCRTPTPRAAYRPAATVRTRSSATGPGAVTKE